MVNDLLSTPTVAIPYCLTILTFTMLSFKKIRQPTFRVLSTIYVLPSHQGRSCSDAWILILFHVILKLYDRFADSLYAHVQLKCLFDLTKRNIRLLLNQCINRLYILPCQRVLATTLIHTQVYTSCPLHLLT